MASAEPMEISSSMQWKMILAASILNGMAWLKKGCGKQTLP